MLFQFTLIHLDWFLFLFLTHQCLRNVFKYMKYQSKSLMYTFKNIFFSGVFMYRFLISCVICLNVRETGGCEVWNGVRYGGLVKARMTWYGLVRVTEFGMMWVIPAGYGIVQQSAWCSMVWYCTEWGIWDAA